MQTHTAIASIVTLGWMTLAPIALADDMTLMVEQDLDRLGYATGPVDGEETMETVIAISKFQAENNLEVTGEVSSDLVRSLMMATPGQSGSVAESTADSIASASAEPAMDPAALQAAQNACLQEKIAASQATQKKKRGLGRLLNAAVRTATRQGNYELSRTANDIYYAGATADDLAAAAEDLGLTEDDVAACQNP